MVHLGLRAASGMGEEGNGRKWGRCCISAPEDKCSTVQHHASHVHTHYETTPSSACACTQSFSLNLVAYEWHDD